MANSVQVPYALVGSGLTKTADIGGSRFGAWSYKAFAPTSYVQETLMTPVQQLSIPPNYLNLSPYGGQGMVTPVQAQAASSTPTSPKSPVFWAVGAILFLSVMFVLKRKGKVK